MTYSETLEYLFTRLPMYQRVGKVAYKKDLTNTIKLMEALNNPQLKFKSVHIAGTNGKGTSAHGISAVMQSAGYKTGLYTSPHLKSFTERIKINGHEIPEEKVVEFVTRLKPSIEKISPSFFEITVAMAFDYFAKENVDIAIIETGLGGRLDSTNVVIPQVSLITNIGYDHMDLLGETLPEIAREKAGIIKPSVPVVVGEQNEETFPVFEEVSKLNKADLVVAQKFDWTPQGQIPNYILKNLPGIQSTIEQLNKQGWQISDAHLKEGLENMNQLTGLKGRFQILDSKPLIIADVSHNEDGLKLLFEEVSTLCKGTLHLVFGTVKDKDLNPIFKEFSANTKIYWTQSGVPRSLSVEELAIQGVMSGLEGECFKNVNEAIKMAKEKVQPEDLILVTGSTFVIAEIENL